MPMWFELLVASLMMLATVALHGAGLFGLSWALDRLVPVAGDAGVDVNRGRRALGGTLLVLGLIAIISVEIWAYAIFYVGSGAVADLREAVYFSTVSFATLGFSDTVIVDAWKLVGAIEAINGALILGWSVAFLVYEMARHLPIRRRSES